MLVSAGPAQPAPAVVDGMNRSIGRLASAKEAKIWVWAARDPVLRGCFPRFAVAAETQLGIGGAQLEAVDLRDRSRSSFYA